MIKRIQFSIFFVLLSNFYQAQSTNLPNELNEISGIEILNDSLFIAHNDGGNSNEVYLLHSNGKIQSKIKISNATNVDWEDITADEEFIYIGDIGNNLNKRKDIKIYRIPKSDLVLNHSVKADVMHISYSDQEAFPPSDSMKNFDAECLISAYGDLWIFSKNRTIPFDGICKVYRFKFTADTSQKIPVYYKIKIGETGWKFDSVTAGDFAFNSFYLSTYNRWICYDFKNNSFYLKNKKNYFEYNQKEALVVSEKLNCLFVANEFHKFFGIQKLKKIKL